MRHLFTALVVTTLLAPAAALAAPARVHLSWKQNLTSSTMAVTWTTDASTGTSVVRYGATASYGSQVTGAIRWSSALALWVHEATLTGLAADATYHYSCGDAADGFSADATFRTAPAKGSSTAFSLAVWSDTQNDSGSNSAFAVTSAMADKILARSPRFSVHSGDVVVSSTQQNWRDFLAVTEKINKLVPFMPVPGNHDNRSDQTLAPVYYDSVALPGNEEYYSFDYGNVHFVGLHTGRPNDVADSALLFRPGTAQYNWLVSDLDQASRDPAITWIIVYHHYPAYAFGVSQALSVRQYLSPLMDQYGVDLVINGHRHDYERMKSINDQVAVQNGPAYTDNPPGTVYNIVGPAGGNVGGGGSTSYTAFSRATAAFGILSVNGPQLSYQAIDASGAVFDSWSITKGAPPPPPPTNLVPNPSFETAGASGSDAASWTEGTSHTRASDRPHAGGWSMKSTFTGAGTASRSPVIAVSPNTTYTLSAWIYRGSTTGGACVDMNDIAGERQLCATQSNVWQFVSGPWSSGSTTSLTLRLVTDGNPNGSIWFDEVSLTSP